MNEEENQEAQTQVILQSFKMNNFKSSKQRFRKKYVTWIYHQILLISLWKTCAMFKVKWALMQGQIDPKCFISLKLALLYYCVTNMNKAWVN